MKSASKFVGLLTAFLFIATFAQAATVTGSVKSPDGTPFRGAFVQTQNTSTRVLVSVLTDKGGRYRIENLPAGKYQVQVKAVGYRTDPRTDVSLTAEQNATYDFALQQGMVRWSDLSQYQGEVLFPDAKGKDLLVGRCFACHGFQSRMASARRDEEGWQDRVAYMKESMHFFLGGVGSPFNDQNASDVASYINSLFGEESVLPKSPAEMPKYKEIVRSFDDDAMKIAARSTRWHVMVRDGTRHRSNLRSRAVNIAPSLFGQRSCQCINLVVSQRLGCGHGLVAVSP